MTTHHIPRQKSRRRTEPALAAMALILGITSSPAQLPDSPLFENLSQLPDRIPVGDPLVAAEEFKEGPKGIASADFNGDGKPDIVAGNLDSTVTVLMNQSTPATVRFGAPQHLHTGALELRSVLAVDLNQDGKPDIAAASPLDGKIIVYFNQGSGVFEEDEPNRKKVFLEGWIGVRCLVSGDFDGDGIKDLAAAGPGGGVRHFRGTGSGNFLVMGDLRRLSPAKRNLTQTRPVYAMHTVRSRDNSRDDVLVTHAEIPELWILSTRPPDYSAEPVVDPATLPLWKFRPARVLIHEVQVQNVDTLRDADGEAQPWAELINKSDAPVNMTGWRLKLVNAEWTFPSVTIPPGRFLTVFLSGKNRYTPELHTDFLLKQSTDNLHLLEPNGDIANTIDLPKHTLTGVSRGLAPDSDDIKWFDVPSPGAVNNAGLGSLDDFTAEAVATLTITPRNPAPEQSATVRVELPAKPTDSTIVRTVWFATTPELRERYFPMHRRSAGVPGVSSSVYEELLRPGDFTGNMPHRVLARLQDEGTSNEYTVEVHRGLDEAEATGTVQTCDGCLRPVASIPTLKVKSFDAAPLTTQAAPNAAPDIIFADDEGGRLRIHRAAQGVRRFEAAYMQELSLAGGGPRDVRIVDTNLDGWNDAIVVMKRKDVAVFCRNEPGAGGGRSLRTAGELPTGTSPREAVIADFTGDGLPDAAIINRLSANVSILPAADNPSGFVASDQVYPVDGDVAGLIVRDLNGDGRADVIQLHRASGEVSIRYAAGDGLLGPPQFIPVGAEGASSMALEDMNGDGMDDILSANLGRDSDGTISLLFANADGTYQPPQFIHAPRGLFAIAVGEFNGDAHMDIVAGLFDCTVRFFFGTETGTFTPDSYTLPLPFVNESRIMVTADFNDDGKTDIAGAGYRGDMAVLINRGAVPTGEWQASWSRDVYPQPSDMEYGAERIAIVKVNNDDDEDLIIGTGKGVILYQGNPAPAGHPDSAKFTLAPLYDEGHATRFAVSDVLTGDLDGDHKPEMVEACLSAACINILSQTPGGRFVVKQQADVPSARYIASGDLDGDGKLDLVGTGDTLWTVLSSRAPQVPTGGSSVTSRPTIPLVLINEVLARNTGIPVASDESRNSDFIELYNGTATPANLAGWKIRVQSQQEGAPVDETWTLPSTTIAPGGRTVVICAPESIPPQAAPMRTGFVLPAEGGTITLLRPDGPDDSIADSASYPRGQENVSWGRFIDGHNSFCANPVPSPGRVNLDSGRPPPEVTLIPPAPSAFTSFQSLEFTARGRDDLAILAMSLVWKRFDVDSQETHRTELIDDGRQDNGIAVDGIFGGQMAPGFPPNADVQFYLEAVDISGNVLRLPENAKLTSFGEPPVAWTFSIKTPPALEIVEVCTDNENLVRDENGGSPDFVKIRNNNGSQEADLSAIRLAQSPLSDTSSIYSFPSGLKLPPNGEVTVFADGNPSEGPLHAPFTLDADGDDLSVLGVTATGAWQWIDSVTIPPMATDFRYLPLPGTPPDEPLHAAVFPGADLTNWSGTAWNKDGAALAAAHFRATPPAAWRVEGDAPGDPVTWTLVESIAADGAMHTITRPLTEFTALRIIPDGGLPVPQVDAEIPGTTSAGICGKAPGAAQVDLFYGLFDEDAVPEYWQFSMRSTGGEFAFAPDNLSPNTVYFYRLRAITTSGETWSDIASFQTLAAGTPVISALALTRLNPASTAVEFKIDPPPPAGSTVSVLAGKTDAFDNVAAWELRPPAAFNALTNTWQASLNGLARETNFFVRVSIAGSMGSVSPQRLVFRTPNASENLTVNLRLSEIMYNPSPPNAAEIAAGYQTDDFEFIELQNVSTESMRLDGLWFSGIAFDFPPIGAPVVPPGGFAVIATHPHAFAMRYGSSIPLAGWTLHPFRNSRLSNAGELLSLHTADGRLVFELLYRDDIRIADGGGYSLEYHQNGGAMRPEAASDYVAGLYYNGSPAFRPDAPPPVSYNSWKSSRFPFAQINNDAVSGMNADPDRDGLTNFAEYACGTHPLVPDPPDVLSSDGWRAYPAGFLTFPANLEAEDALVSLESSTASPPAWTVERNFTYNDLFPFYHQPFGSNWKQVRVTVPVPHPDVSGLRKLYRLKIVKR